MGDSKRGLVFLFSLIVFIGLFSFMGSVSAIDQGISCESDVDCTSLDLTYCSLDLLVDQVGVCNQNTSLCEISNSSVVDCAVGGELDSSCYVSPLGTCNSETLSCDSPVLDEDEEGPVTSNITITKVLGTCQVNIMSTETDTCSVVTAAEYFVGSCGDEGTGDALNVTDGIYDSLVEQVMKNKVGVSDGSIDIYVRGQDALGNWGQCEQVTFASDCLPVDYPTCAIGNTNPNAEYAPGINVNGQCNAEELLICGNDPEITANICDSESLIQLAEYFIDDMPLTNWQGINMSAIDGSFYDEACEDVSATVDISELIQGTHYIQLHGKDTQENWGKLPNSPTVSFIKDTDAPNTTKTISFADNISKECDFQEANGNELTDGCYYVKPGTNITLSAIDPDTIDHEIAGSPVVHYNIYYSEDCTIAEPEWTLQSSGEGNPNEDVSLTLEEDSCHLIEYWATDLCVNEEEHHYELDIVDSKAPVSEKTLGYPKVECSQDVKDLVGEEDCWYVNTSSQVELSCEDSQPHPIDDVSIYYRIGWKETFEDDYDWSDYSVYEGSFSYEEDSIHKLEWSCVDALGNVENTHTEIDIVDSQAPVFNKELIGAKVPAECNEEYNFGCYYINQNTLVNVTAVDPEPHPSNDVEVWCEWRVVSENAGAIRKPFLVTEPFNFEGDSEHHLHCWANDSLGNTADLWELDYVDSQPPITTKTIEGPKYTENCIEEGSCWITQESNVTLSCEDQQPHPVNDITLYYRTTLDGEVLEDWTSSKEDVLINFNEDSNHSIEWYCVDALGNAEELQTENDTVDTQGPSIFKWVNDTTVQPGDEVQICANITDYKQTGDLGVGVNDSTIWGILTLGNDPYDVPLTPAEGNTYCGTWVAPPINEKCHDYKCLWDLHVNASDLLGNYNIENGVQIIVDKAKPKVKFVLNPTSGQYYRDGKQFSVYAPAIDFGGDWNIKNYDQCRASGVLECRWYAVDYPFEDINQTEIKNYWDYKWALGDVFDNPDVVYLGSTPYVDGICKGIVQIPEDSGLTDKAFLAYEIEDNAGNINGDNETLAKDFNGDAIILDIDNEGPGIVTTDLGNTPGPLTSGDVVSLKAEAVDYQSGFDGCYADLYSCDENGSNCDVDTGINLDGEWYGDVCEINDILPTNTPNQESIQSGYYKIKINARDELGNIGSDWASLTIDNKRPNMSIVSPEEEGVYGALLPVSLHIEDDTNVASETVKFKLSEIPAIGNLFCVFGSCEETEWLTLTDQGSGIYADTINITEYGISGQGRYVMDAVACDNLYTPEPDTDLGFSIGNSRTDMHCRMISEHGGVSSEVRTQCSDGLDNDGDGNIDLNDIGCDNPSDDDETDIIE